MISRWKVRTWARLQAARAVASNGCHAPKMPLLGLPISRGPHVPSRACYRCALWPMEAASIESDRSEGGRTAFANTGSRSGRLPSMTAGFIGGRKTRRELSGSGIEGGRDRYSYNYRNQHVEAMLSLSTIFE